MSTTDFNETPGTSRYRKSNTSLKDLWRTKPLFKLVVVLLVLAGAGLGANAYVSRNKKVEESFIPGPGVAATDDNKPSSEEVSPAYAQAIQEQSESRITEARGTGESAIPTPMQNPVMNPSLNNITDEISTDPLRAFEESIQQRVNNTPPAPVTVAPVVPAIPPEAVQAMQRQMQAQIDQLGKEWTAGSMTALVVSIKDTEMQPIQQVSISSGTGPAGTVAAAAAVKKKSGKVYIPSGAVHYGQMLMEANSDVPGPVMAQMLTGPLAGARLIGSFETFRNHLVVRFKTISFRRKEIATDILVLDPATTIGGIATEVDPRYFTRVVLPAAGEFIRAIGESFSEDTSTISVTGTGDTAITTNSEDENTLEDALFEGLEASADRVGRFLDEEATATKRLVRVAVGTPVGLFFVKPVTECDFQAGCTVDVQ